MKIKGRAKEMNTEKNLIPLLRFPEFEKDGMWEEKCFGDCLGYEQPQQYLVSTDNYKKEGTPVLTAGKTFILGFTDESYGIYSQLPVIIFDDFTTASRYVNFPFKAKSSAMKMLQNKDGYDLKFMFEALQNYKYEPKVHQRHWISIFQNFKTLVPSYSEQQKIAECLSSIDSYISSINEKVEQLKAHKIGLLQKLFPQGRGTVPEYRFSEFEKISAWEKKKLGDVTTVINRRNKSNRSLPIYSISNKDGFILQSEQFDRLDSESRGYDISLYKIVGRNTFAYNPARINIGSVGYSGDLKEVLISSLYVCFKTTDELDDEFLTCFLKTAQFNQAVENNVEGGIRSYLFYENFSRINICLPSLQEQKKIALIILSIDDIISKYTDKVSLMEDYKKGLMQQLFPTITK